jgi:glucose-6-phosphate 1-epimerase
MNAAATHDSLAGAAMHVLGAGGASAQVLEHGAQLVSWRSAGAPQLERLYLSPLARLGVGEAVRGGAPVIFPQFERRGPDRSLPRHGFARQRLWLVQSATPEGVVLRLEDDESLRAAWPHPFALTLKAELAADELRLTLECENTGAQPFEFSAALHTYLRVDALKDVRIEGLQGLDYIDCTDADALRTQRDAALSIEGEVDRIYRRAGARTLVVRQPGSAVASSLTGFDEVVVWNPGPRAAAIADLPAGDESRFVCVEAAIVTAPPRLAPGERWSGQQRLRAL